MANLIGAATTSAITLVASTEKTALQITAGTNQKVKILRWGVFFNEETGDATPATPLLVKAGRHTVASGTGSSNTPKLVKKSGVSLRTTALDNFSAVATISDVLDEAYVNAQTGYEVIFPMGQEIELDPSETFSLNVVPGATLSTGGLSCIAKIWFEE